MAQLLSTLLTTSFFLSFYLQFSFSSDDSSCPVSQDCTSSASCPWFQQKIDEKSGLVNGSDAYKQILDLLKTKICNKGEHRVCCCKEGSATSPLCFAPSSSEQKEAGIICSVEELCDPVGGLVCKTTCEQVSQFSVTNHKIGSIPNCRCGRVYSIRRGRCVRNRDPRVRRMCATG